MQTTQSVQQKKRKVRPTKEGRAGKGPAKLSRGNATRSQRINVQNRIRATLTGTRVFDRSLQKTNTWLKELMTEMNWDNRERALSALRATLHALRDILPLPEIIDLGAQLPLIVRGLYYESWHHNPEPLRIKTITEFYELVRENLGNGKVKFTNDDLRQFTRASLAVLAKHVSQGEMREVEGTLKKNLKVLIEDAIRESAETQMPSEKEGRSPRRNQSRNTIRRAQKKVANAKKTRQNRIVVKATEKQGPIH